MSGDNRPLSGRTVVITRPSEQGAPLAALVREQGGDAILFPVIEILDPIDPARLDALIGRLDEFDAAVFISPNAVNKGLAAVRAQRELPPHLAMIVVGAGSARALRSHGVTEVIVPKERFDSEALLELPELADVAGKRIAIFRGSGGRPLLGDTLAARGAIVEYAECYRRVRPDADAAPLLERWARGGIDAFVATSSEGLRNLHEIVGERGCALLADTAVFVPHPRIEATARELGLRAIVLTRPGDERIAQDLARHFSRQA